jgi:sugar lactone lactonase YvrE
VLRAALAANLLVAACGHGRAAWTLVDFEPAGRIGRGEYHYYPLKVAARGGWVAVLDGSPNLGYRNSRVLLFRKALGRLAAASEIPRGAQRGAKGHALSIDRKGRVYVAVEDAEKTHVLRLVPGPGGRSLFRQEWDSILGGKYPTGILVDPKDQIVLVDGGNHRIIRLAWKGMDPMVIGSSRELDHPRGIAIDPQGNLYTHTIQGQKLLVLKYAPSGSLLASFPVEGVQEPLAWFYNDLVVDSQGRIYLTDYAKARVLVLGAGGEVLREIKDPTFKGPMGLALDEDGSLYVADAWAKSVLHLRPVYEHELRRRRAPGGPAPPK